MHIINYEQFSSVDLRSGTIIRAEIFERTRNPAYKVWVDFGESIGILTTSAQITHHYTPENLIGKKVVGCINLGEKNIAGFKSQFLLTGFADTEGKIVLTAIDMPVPNGTKIG